MHLFELQFAWFFAGASPLDYEKLASLIRQKTKRPFVSPAMFIPLPPLAPAEIPRVQLQTVDNSSKASIALNRADFFVSSTNLELSNEQINTFFSDAIVISEILLGSTGVVRLALVGRIYKESNNPADEIAASFVKLKFENLQEVSVKFVERYVVDKFAYNDSYQFDIGLKTDTQQKILVITRDVNTAPDVLLNVTMELIRDFSSVAKDRLDEKLIDELMGKHNGH